LSASAENWLPEAPYDANLLNSGTGTNVWDFENRLIQDGSVNIIYEGDGNRVSETVAGVTTKYLVDTQNPAGYAQVIDELVNGSVTRTYAYGLQRISQNQLIGGAWTPSFYGYDAHSNVRYLTNAASTVTDTYQYDAFGNLLRSTGSTPNNYRFSGEPFDPALGMYQMRARWYRQATGRFMSRDPIEGVMCCGLSWNSYIYTRENPVNRLDPNGTEDEVEYEELTNNVAKIANRLNRSQKAIRCAIHALKRDLAGYIEGNPDVLIDPTNGNAYLPISLDLLGCLIIRKIKIFIVGG
jgi:RHS repeat-associated protein